MSESGKNIVDGFRVLRKFCNDVSLMLTTANGLMREGGWTRVSKRTPAVETRGDLDDPNCWLPDAFFCFYEHDQIPHLLAFVAIHVDDLQTQDPSLVTEAVVSAGCLDYGAGTNAKGDWGKDYSACYSHLWVKNRVDDGTVFSGDAVELYGWDDTSVGAVKVTTFAHPLDEITSSQTLKQKIVQPLLAAISKEASDHEPTRA